MNSYRLIASSVLATLLGGTVSVAQETRAEDQKQQREEKRQKVEPYDPNALERTLKAIETGGVPLITRDGIYLRFGSITTGSGFATGAGFRTQRLMDGDAALDTWAGASLKGYWAAEARLRFPRLAGGHLQAEGYGRLSDYPQEDYFGLGPDSPRSGQADFRLRSKTFGGRAAVRMGTRRGTRGRGRVHRPRRQRWNRQGPGLD